MPSHFSLALSVTLAAAVGAGDRQAVPGRIAAPTAAAVSPVPAASPAWRSGGGVPPAPHSPIPRFALFGWVSPPPDSTNAARYDELAAAGMNVALPALDDTGGIADTLARLDLAATRGIGCLMWEKSFERLHGSPANPGLLDSIVGVYSGRPGFLGYYFADEPDSGQFGTLATVFDELRARDPLHPAWNNLLGRGGFATRADWEAYTRRYLTEVKPAILCNDQYDFLASSDRGQFVENVAGLRAWSREFGIPFWCIVQLVPYTGVRALTQGELEWQVSTLLAYGARGVGYFTYWTPAPDARFNWGSGMIAWDGQRTSWYPLIAAFNRSVRAAGETLAGLTWLSTEHAGSVPVGGTAFAPDGWVSGVEGRAALGEFVDSLGAPYLLVANSDSLSARTLSLTLPGAKHAWQLETQLDGWTELPLERNATGARLDLALEAGGFALVRLEGVADSLASGRAAPALAAFPNPAGGELRLALSRLAGPSRVEILDSGGRRVWGRTLSNGEATLLWRGERDSGGEAAAGIYFVRVEDARGVAARRISWLGAR